MQRLVPSFKEVCSVTMVQRTRLQDMGRQDSFQPLLKSASPCYSASESIRHANAESAAGFAC